MNVLAFTWAVITLSAVLLAGVSKLAVPAPLAGSLLILWPGGEGRLAFFEAATRALGLAESIVVLAAIATSGHPIGLIAGLGLGIGIVAFATWAPRRATGLTCGCFGSTNTELGGRNVLAGTGIAITFAMWLAVPVLRPSGGLSLLAAVACTALLWVLPRSVAQVRHEYARR